MKRTKLPDKKEKFDLGVKEVPGKGLSGRFIFPPFSILRASGGDWQRRKRQWISLGIESEIGRGAKSIHTQSWVKEKIVGTGLCKNTDGGGTSIFDPVLCELMYTWFCPVNGQVVDPFAGGSVRGIVAHFMGYKYWGSELRPEQVQANEKQGQLITPNNPPVWVCGDAWQELKSAPRADFVFSCPPYGNLEVYSELKEDISNMSYADFLQRYICIIRRACHLLKRDRFACFVVGNFRDKQGFLHDFVGDTVRAFEQANVKFYNELILVTAIGSLPIRVGRQFAAGRKIGKTHQNVLVFYKGDPKAIKENFNKE